MKAEMETLAGLAQRVEALSGPEREVDADIRLTLLGDCQYGVLTGNRHQAIGPAYLSGYVSTYRDVLTADDVLDDDVVPRYTASLDAAMTLAQPNWWLRLSGPLSEKAYGYSRIEDRVFRAGFDMIGAPYCVGATGKTPALAVTAACLRARARPTDAQDAAAIEQRGEDR